MTIDKKESSEDLENSNCFEENIFKELQDKVNKLVNALKEVRKLHPYNETVRIIDEALKGH